MGVMIMRTDMMMKVIKLW